MSTLHDQLKKLGISAEQLNAAKDKRKEQLAAVREAEEESAKEHLKITPRYENAGPLTLSEARKVLEGVPKLPENKQVEGNFDPEVLTLPSVQLISGDVEVDELHLPAEGSNLFIQGSLTVRGILKQDFRAGGLLVLGDLRAGHIVTTGGIDCTGNLTVDGVLYGNCTNYGTSVWKMTRAKLLVSAKEHLFSFWGGRAIETIIDTDGSTPNLDGRRYNGDTMREVLMDEVGDGYDEENIARLLRQHDTLLRQSP